MSIVDKNAAKVCKEWSTQCPETTFFAWKQTNRTVGLLYGQPFYFLCLLSLHYSPQAETETEMGTNTPSEWRSAAIMIVNRLHIGVAETALHASKAMMCAADLDAAVVTATIEQSPLLQLQRMCTLPAAYEQVKRDLPTEVRNKLSSMTIRTMWEQIKPVHEILALC